MSDDWPKFKECPAFELLEGPGNGTIIPLRPSMKQVWHDGERYFRMAATRRTMDDGSMIACYLWDGYWPERLAKRDEGG